MQKNKKSVDARRYAQLYNEQFSQLDQEEFTTHRCMNEPLQATCRPE